MQQFNISITVTYALNDETLEKSKPKIRTEWIPQLFLIVLYANYFKIILLDNYNYSPFLSA